MRTGLDRNLEYLSCAIPVSSERTIFNNVREMKNKSVPPIIPQGRNGNRHQKMVYFGSKF